MHVLTYSFTDSVSAVVGLPRPENKQLGVLLLAYKLYNVSSSPTPSIIIYRHGMAIKIDWLDKNCKIDVIKLSNGGCTENDKPIRVTRSSSRLKKR